MAVTVETSFFLAQGSQAGVEGALSIVNDSEFGSGANNLLRKARPANTITIGMMIASKFFVVKCLEIIGIQN